MGITDFHSLVDVNMFVCEDVMREREQKWRIKYKRREAIKSAEDKMEGKNS